MIPNLALTLSFDGIGLTRRSPGGWEPVGHVALDAPDLADRLQALRDTATALYPEGIATAVVLPDEQILNRHLPGVAEEPAAVAAALDGLTPYAVADLVFDWRPHPDGGVVVAAVARETIDEALAFARQYGFNPVALTARPAAGLPFAHEPDFGPAAVMAATSADKPTSAPEAPATATDTPSPEMGSAVAPDSQPGIVPVATDVAEVEASGSVEEGFSTRRSRTPAHPEAARDPQGNQALLLEHPSETPVVDPDDAQAIATARIAALPARLTVLDPASQTGPVEDPSDVAAGGATLVALHQAAASPEGESIDPGVVGGTSSHDPGQEPDSLTETQVPDPVPAATAASVPQVTHGKSVDASPATRLVAATRNGGANSSRPTAAGRPVGAVRRAGGIKSGTGGAAVRGAKKVGTMSPPRAGTDAGPARLAEPSLVARSAAATMSVRALGDPTLAESPRGMASMPVVVGLVAALLIALAAAVGLSRVVIGWLAPPTDVVVISADAPMVAAVPVPEPTVEAAPAEVVPDVARSLAEDSAAPSLPREDTPIADVAVIPPPVEQEVIQPQTSEVAVAPEVSEPPAPAPARVPQPSASGPSPVVADTGGATGPEGPGSQTGAVPRPSPDTVAAPRSTPARLSPPDGSDTLPQIPSQFVLGPGPAPVVDPDRPAPVLAPQAATLLLASADPAVSLQDPLALVAPGQAAVSDLPEIQPLPPPGVTYRLDDRGLVIATTEGALAPEGHLVTLGRPSLVPPARPLTATPAPAVASDPATVQRLARLRPPPRPAALQTAPVTDEASAVSPASPPVDLAAEDVATAVAEAASAARTPDDGTVRPPPRPAVLASGAVSTPPDAEPALLTNATARAIPVSVRPASRPAGLDAIAAAASVRIAPLPPAETGSPAAEAPTAPRQDFDYDDGEPEVASAAPRIPSSASVARQATVDNALNLRELNLIGVYGTASDRRALVRLPSGRFVKVEIGDRVDGGQVADIGDRDLRYVKGGRSFVLSMPRG